MDKARRGWIRRLWSACIQHPRLLYATLAAVAGGAIAEVAAPLAAKQALDSARAGNVAAIGPLVGVLVALGLVRFATTYARRWSVGMLALRVQYQLRLAMLDALHHYDGPRQNRLRTGQLVSRAISDLDTVQTFLAVAPLAGLTLLLTVLSAVAMLVLSPPLALVALLTVPAVAVVAARMRPRVHAATWSARQRAADLAQHVSETVTGVRVVKGFGQEDRMVQLLAQHSGRLYGERMRAAYLTARMSPTMAAIPQAGLAAVIGMGGLLALHGTISVGTMLAFAAYVTTLAASTRTLTNVVMTAQLTSAAAERVYQVIDDVPAAVNPAHPRQIPAGPLGLQLRSVTFGFDPDRPILRDFDLTVQPGETVAIIGPAGAGKSTLALLVPRFFSPDAGRISLCGTDTAVDISEVTTADLRSAVAVVFDEPLLFSDTIAANIALGKPEASTDDIRRAAQLAAADDFITELPEGYDTVVGERGLTLSGGQRQRVALARALLADPRVLILDDATSAIDALTEATIFAALPHGRDRTTVILAHRESTLAHADRIVRLPPPASAAEDSTLWPDQVAEPDQPVPVELRTVLDGLPPATARPALDEQLLRQPDPHFRLVRTLRLVRSALAVVLVLLAITSTVEVAFPAVTRYALDQGVLTHRAGVLLPAVLGSVALVLVGWAVGAAGIVFSARAGEGVLYALRIRSFAHLQRLGLDFYERELSGRIMTRMTTDVDALSTFLQTDLVDSLISVITAVGIAVALLLIDVWLALVVLASLPVVVAATLVFRSMSSKAYAQARERVAVVNADFQENVAGLRVTQAYRYEPAAAARFAGYAEAYRHTRMRAQRAIALYSASLMVWADLAQAAVVYVGAREVAHATTTAGTLVAFVLYLDLLFGPIMQLSQVFDSYQQARVGLRRIGQLLGTPSSIAPDPPDPVPVGTRLRGEALFDDVRFYYPTAHAPAPTADGGVRSGFRGHTAALDSVSLRIPAGSSLALVGETGAGKSTIVKLLARLYDLPRPPVDDDGRPGSTGAIRMDGVDIRDFRLADYRGRLGLVPQEAHLFAGDVASNIAFGKPWATHAEIEAAAAAVGALDMIAGLHHGMRQPISEAGGGLSAGQRQLIALARAELVDPDLLLFDEATAVLDPESEQRVLAANRSVMHGRTAVIVAHRLATAARADRIAVVDHGRIVEIGTHDELLAAGRHYSRLWSATPSR